MRESTRTTLIVLGLRQLSEFFLPGTIGPAIS